MSRLRPLTDPYDELTDRLAEMPDWDRPHPRPSTFPSARAFIDAMDATRVAPVNVGVLSPARESTS